MKEHKSRMIELLPDELEAVVEGRRKLIRKTERIERIELDVPKFGCFHGVIRIMVTDKSPKMDKDHRHYEKVLDMVEKKARK